VYVHFINSKIVKAMKDNNLTLFSHPQLGEIRVQQINGEPWFVGKDVADVLGYSNTKDAICKHVDPEDKLGSQIATSGQRREMTLINESGLYALILTSKLPQAKEFKRWVTSEVLPQIRKTGGYISLTPSPSPNGEGGTVSDQEILCRALMILKKTIDLKDELIADLAPKAEYTDKVLQSPTCYTMTQVAKGLSMTVYQLTFLLIQRGIIYHSPSGPYMLYKKYLNRGLEAYRTKCGENLFGEPIWTDTYLVWTEAGRKLITESLS